MNEEPVRERLTSALDREDTKARHCQWRLDERQWALFRAGLGAPGAIGGLARLLARRGTAIAAAGLAPPVALSTCHHARSFDCGVGRLDDPFAPSADPSTPLRTRVLARDNAIVAYYATRAICAVREAVPEDSIPLLMVARFAIDRRHRHPGLAQDLFAHLLHEEFASDAPRRAVIGFAVSAPARRFFMQCGVRPAGAMVDPSAILVSMADMARALRSPQ